MKNKKIIWFSAFHHIVPADYEKWLEKMAAAGWHIDHFRQYYAVCLIFRRGAPQNYRFICDPQISPKEDYLSTGLRAGWEYLGSMAGFHFWRLAYTGPRPESFAGTTAPAAERQRRTIVAAAVIFFIFLALEVLFAGIMTIYRKNLSPTDKKEIIIAEIFFVILTITLGVALLTIGKNKKR